MKTLCLKMANCSCRYCSLRYIRQLAITEIALSFNLLFFFLSLLNHLITFFHGLNGTLPLDLLSHLCSSLPSQCHSYSPIVSIYQSVRVQPLGNIF